MNVPFRSEKKLFERTQDGSTTKKVKRRRN